MTLLSFRVAHAEADEAQRWAARLGVDLSELLREALRRHLVRLCGVNDSEKWQAAPLTDAEGSIAKIADWGPAEDWADWDDAAG